MCECLSFIIVPWRKVWKPALVRLLYTIRTQHFVYPAIEVQTCKDLRESSRGETSAQVKKKCIGECLYYVPRTEQEGHDCVEHDSMTALAIGQDGHTHKARSRLVSSGGNENVSLFTKQGRKGINQDTMVVIQGFASCSDSVFCGVFDGHGPDGHLVARNVRDVLPQKLASSWCSQQPVAEESTYFSEDGDSDRIIERDEFESTYFSEDGDSDRIIERDEFVDDPTFMAAWKDSFRTAFKLMDRELLMNYQMDCVASGTTAVALVKEGRDLIIGNLGDSRAILGTRADDGSLRASQLTVDLKPEIPREAERIKRYDGRVFALQREPSVFRVWLPDRNAPGLAMSRAFGDYCLKNYGVISEPEVSYRRLTKKDEFVVLATDGVWDVLSNQEVVSIVESAPNRAMAAKAVVEKAVYVWRSKYALWKVDDCAVVCLFL